MSQKEFMLETLEGALKPYCHRVVCRLENANQGEPIPGVTIDDLYRKVEKFASKMFDAAHNAKRIPSGLSIEFYLQKKTQDLPDHGPHARKAISNEIIRKTKEVVDEFVDLGKWRGR